MNVYERDWVKIMTQNYVEDIHDPDHFWWSIRWSIIYKNVNEVL